jgi:hypothetical protein
MTDLLHTKILKAKSCAPLLSWIVFITLEFLVLVQGVLAYRNHFLTVYQMEHNNIHGLPFLWHFGMWGDFFIISPSVAYLVRHYFHQWRLSSVSISFIISAISAVLLGWLYTFYTIPEAHMQNHHLTSVGIIHLLYMVVSVTIFLEFFLFTPSVTPSDLRVLSGLVLFHVFLGTHMALAILQFIMRLEWYPGEPLKSVAGYLTIIAIATALFWRNLQVDSFARNLQCMIERVANIFMYWVEDDIYAEQKVKTPHGLLTFLDKIGDRVLEVGFFVVAAWTIFSKNNGVNSVLAGLLVLVFAAKFRLSRRSAKVELAIGERLFPAGRLPENWSGPKDPVGITSSTIYFFALYMALAWFANNIVLVSFVIFIIACIDWNTRRLIHKNIKRYFSDDRYAAKIEDNDYEAITASREEVTKYLFNNPHLWKEGGCVAGCAVALSIALFSVHIGSYRLRSTTYVIILATLVVNEIITWRWRSIRDRNLKAIEVNRMVRTAEKE